MKDQSEALNSCDGCQRGLPICKTEYMGKKIHMAGRDEIHIFCTKDQYEGCSHMFCGDSCEFSKEGDAIAQNVQLGIDTFSPPTPEVSEWEKVASKTSLKAYHEMEGKYAEFSEIIYQACLSVRNQTLEEAAEALESIKSKPVKNGEDMVQQIANALGTEHNDTLSSAQATIRLLKK